MLQARIAELEDELESERSGRVKVTSSFTYFIIIIVILFNRTKTEKKYTNVLTGFCRTERPTNGTDNCP